MAEVKKDKAQPDETLEKAKKGADEKVEETATSGAENEASPEENTEAKQEEKPSDAKDGKKKKKKDKENKKDPRDEEIEDLKDRLTRNLAEFDNFRKRSEREKSQMFGLGEKSIVEAILPVVDNFERGLATIDAETLENDPFASGMEKTYKQLLKVFEDVGVKEIEALGTEFNPDLHNAVMHEDNDKFGENTVSEVFQKGYMLNDVVVRHSMVKVAN